MKINFCACVQKFDHFVHATMICGFQQLLSSELVHMRVLDDDGTVEK